MNGQALDLFGAGRYTLETQNIPLIKKYFNFATNDKTPFHCELYFINKTEQMAIKWGTDSKVEYIEPTYKFPIQLGACGEMSLRVTDSRKLLIKIVGTEAGITQALLVQKFRAFLMTKIKSYLSNFICERNLSIFSIDSQLTVISEALLERLKPDFSDYGVSLERFFVTTIVKPEEDRSYQKFKELHFRQYADVAEAQLRQQVGLIEQQTSAQRMVIEAQGIAQKRSIEGYTYKDERGFDVVERIAANEAIGQFTNLGVGMGVISGVGGTVGGIIQNSMNEALDNSNSLTKICPVCKSNVLEGAKFCPECGNKIIQPEINQLICPKCGQITPKGKFCMECGKVLASLCPDCHKELPQGAKFCLECGKKL